MNFLFKAIGGSRMVLYPVAGLICLALVSFPWLAARLAARDDDAALRESGKQLAAVIARHHGLTVLRKAKEADLQAALARAFKDGQALGAKSHPNLVLHGSTKPHTENTSAGPIDVVSTLDAAVVTIPADGKAYARAEITTRLTLTKFSEVRTFTMPVELESALINDMRPLDCPPKSSPTKPPTLMRPRTLFGLDGGLNLSTASAGYEVGGRLYPASLAFKAKWGEARVGFYVRAQSNASIAAGLSILGGIGRE